MNNLSLLFLLVGPIYIITGFVLKLRPPKEINKWYGYRIGKAIQSQKGWELSQPFAGKQMMKQGFIFFIIGLLSLFITSSEEKWIAVITIIIPIGAILVGVGHLIYKTEKYVEQELKSHTPSAIE